MEQLSPLQYMSRYIQLEKDIDGVKKKFQQQKAMFLQISDAVLRAQIDIPAVQAPLNASRKDLAFAIHHYTKSLHQANQEEQQSNLAHLKTVKSRVHVTLAHLLTLTSPNNFLQRALENCRLQIRSSMGKLSELKNECRRLAHLIRFAGVKVLSIEDAKMVLLFREKTDWSGKICLADGLENAQKDILTFYICSTALVDRFDR